MKVSSVSLRLSYVPKDRRMGERVAGEIYSINDRPLLVVEPEQMTELGGGENMDAELAYGVKWKLEGQRVNFKDGVLLNLKLMPEHLFVVAQAMAARKVTAQRTD